MSETQTTGYPRGRRGLTPPLRVYRAARGLSQEQLAQRAGVSVATLGRLERGTHRPREATVRVLASALGVSVQALFPEEPDG